MLRICLTGRRAEVGELVGEDSRREGGCFFSELCINCRSVLSICRASVICDSTSAKRYSCSATDSISG
jgi:hypothetical protein